jgi:hypothetical protein
MLTVLMTTLVRGDGAESGKLLFAVYGNHGVNRNDAPVIVVWAVGVIATGVLFLRR